MVECANGQTDRAVTSPTSTPRVAAPMENAAASSSGDRGGVRKSGAVPMIFAWISDDDELAKALVKIAIMIRPGATNWANGTPSTVGLALRIATTNTIM